MTLSELKTVLTGITGYSTKVVYHSWPEGQAPDLPFICFFEVGENGFAADGKNYFGAHQVRVELYTQTKSQTDEALVEAALTSAGIYFTKECQYLDDEKCWFTLYSMEV